MVRPTSPVRRNSTPTNGPAVVVGGGGGVSGKMNSTFSPVPVVNRHVYPPVMSYPGLYDGGKAAVSAATTAPPPHYFNMGGSLPIGYSTPSLAHLHQYFVAAHLQSGLANPLRNVPLPVHNNSPLYKSTPNDVVDPADVDRKRKRSDSGIEDRFDSKVSRYDNSKLPHVRNNPVVN